MEGERMKLRNKKTGEIKSIEEIIRDAFLSNDFDSLKIIDINWEDWEDYNSKEPLIKDEKIRKAVRAFAEVIGVSELVYGTNGEFYMGAFSLQIHQIDIPSGTYTIAELCGEEKECEN